MIAAVNTSIVQYIYISFIFDLPATASMNIYASPHIAIHQNWIRVMKKSIFSVLNIIYYRVSLKALWIYKRTGTSLFA
jgi:hypothetical protein